MCHGVDLEFAKGGKQKIFCHVMFNMGPVKDFSG